MNSPAESPDSTFTADHRSFPRRRALLWLGSLLVLACLIVFSAAKWGGWWLVDSEPAPPHADAAVVLQGSMLGERARIAGAVALLQARRVDRILVGLPSQSYWGEPLLPMATAYFRRTFGDSVASSVDFCSMSVNSTEEESLALIPCIQAHGWHDLVIVTSDYHTRRARIAWSRTLQQHGPILHTWMYGVADPEFQADGWWHQRLWAKTWFLEFTKLIWTMFGD